MWFHYAYFIAPQTCNLHNSSYNKENTEFEESLITISLTNNQIKFWL